jgi:hypothetical protein
MHEENGALVGVRFKVAYILVHQTSLADTTVTKDNHLSLRHKLWLRTGGKVKPRTFNRTFFLEDIFRTISELHGLTRQPAPSKYGDDNTKLLRVL